MRNFLNYILTEDEQKILLFLVFFALLGLSLHFSGLIADEDATPADSINFEKDYEIKYDLNLVTLEELKTIPKIGEKKAKDILSFREQNGFGSRADLMKIKGIGEKTFLKIKDYFYEFEDEKKNFGENELFEQEVIITKININTAYEEDLITLIGIGPSKAKRIIELRQKLGKFSDINQLLEVKGIGTKTLAKFRKQICLEDE